MSEIQFTMSMFACNYKKMKAEKLSVIDLFNTGYTHIFPLPHFLDSFITESNQIFPLPHFFDSFIIESNQFNSLTGFLKRIGIIEASQHKFMSSIHSTVRLPPERHA